MSAGPRRPSRADRFVDDIDEWGIEGAIVVQPEDQIEPSPPAEE